MKKATILLVLVGIFSASFSNSAEIGRATLRVPELAAQPQAATTPEQRQRIVAVTRALEKTPFQVGATKDREGVLYLIDHAPDIFPRLQGQLTSKIVDSGVPDWRPVYAQFVFGFVSFQVENPERANDARAVYQAAIESCLKVYRHALERDDANRIATLDVASEHERKGTLQNYVEQLVAD